MAIRLCGDQREDSLEGFQDNVQDCTTITLSKFLQLMREFDCLIQIIIFARFFKSRLVLVAAKSKRGAVYVSLVLTRVVMCGWR